MVKGIQRERKLTICVTENQIRALSRSLIKEVAALRGESKSIIDSPRRRARAFRCSQSHLFEQPVVRSIDQGVRWVQSPILGRGSSRPPPKHQARYRIAGVHHL